jgi:serine/threonine protein kinase
MTLKKPLIFETTFAKYSAIEIIGEGGSGIIYKATDDTKAIWAIKRLSPNSLSKDKIKRFKNELTFCSRNKHPNIVTIIDHGIFKYSEKNQISLPFYVMPLYSSSLKILMQKGIPKSKTLSYFFQLLDGIEAAHLQQVIHRDIKPENILYDQTDDKLLISDFGIAHFEEDELFTAAETKDNARLANFLYAAPEQRSRGINVDRRADIYALGLILNEIFTGQVPHGTNYKTIKGVAPEFEYLDELVSTMICQAPKDRPESIEVLKNKLVARKEEFINFQKLSKLNSTVIPVSDIDDLLVNDPPRLVGFNWDRGLLELVLSQPVNDKWVWALQNMGSHSSAWNKGPERFKIAGNKARIEAEEREVQDIIDHFKNWIPRVTKVYEQRIRRENQETEERKRTEIKRQIEQEEARHRVLSKVKI